MPTIPVVGGPAAWRGPELAASSDWKVVLDATQQAELLALVHELGNARLRDVGPDHARLPHLAPALTEVRRELLDGYGIVLLRGLPINGLTIPEAELMFWCVGLHLGTPMRQNPHGDVMIHVRDEGKQFGSPDARAYETRARLEWHSDSSDIVGLLCLHPAAQGGESRVVSAVAVHDEIARTRPDLATVLHEGPWWHKGMVGDGTVRYTQRAFWVLEGDKLFTRYGRAYMDAAHEYPDVPDMTPAQVEALDLWDELASSAEFRLDMDFEPGDAQFLNNYVMMHSRGEYEDGATRGQQRDLCRLWLIVDDLDVPASIAETGIFPRSTAFQC